EAAAAEAVRPSAASRSGAQSLPRETQPSRSCGVRTRCTKAVSGRARDAQGRQGRQARTGEAARTLRRQRTMSGVRTRPAIAAAAATLAAAIVALGTIAGATRAEAAPPAAAWSVSSYGYPTNFSTGDNAGCSVSTNAVESLCDTYTVTATNIGGATTSGAVTIGDELPPGITPHR